MPTPCQTFAETEGYEALDKMFFTSAKRAEKAAAMFCSQCPATAECATISQSIVSIEGVIRPTGLFGGVFHE